MSGNRQPNGGAGSAKAESATESVAPAPQAPTAATSEIAKRKRVVAQAVAAADVKACEREQYEAGNDPRLNVRGLILGPQKYLDPDLWRPPYHLLPEDSLERQAFEKGHPIPLTQDPLLGKTLDLVFRLGREQK